MLIHNKTGGGNPPRTKHPFCWLGWVMAKHSGFEGSLRILGWALHRNGIEGASKIHSNKVKLAKQIVWSNIKGGGSNSSSSPVLQHDFACCPWKLSLKSGSLSFQQFCKLLRIPLINVFSTITSVSFGADHEEFSPDKLSLSWVICPYFPLNFFQFVFHS